MRSQNVEHPLDVVVATTGLERLAEHRLHLVVVEAFHVLGARPFARPYGPTSQRSRDVHDVGLRIAAIHAQRMQLHQLSCVVLVDAARGARGCAASLGSARRASWGLLSDILPVIEVEEHGRALRGGFEHVAEVTEHIRPDGFAFVLAQVIARRALAGEHVEVVEPEVDQHFLQLPLAVEGAQQLGLLDVGDHLPRLRSLGFRRVTARRAHVLSLARRLSLSRRSRLRRRRRILSLSFAPCHHRRARVVSLDGLRIKRQRL